MKTLGMIGGTSWHSTIVYYRLINELVGEKIGTQGNPPLIIYSLNIELMREGDKNKINNAYLEIANKLENAGAEALVICANTPHMVYPFVTPKINIPILHIADATGKSAVKKGIKKLGLLGNRPTMTGGFLQKKLNEDYGLEIIIPEEKNIEQTHYYISYELTQGKFTDEAKQFYLQRMEELKNRGAEGIILGCTELPMLIKENEFDLPMMATTDLHAQMAADFILGGVD
ncbi:MAG: amino acid racemase [Saprospiraceae bacterium]